MKGKAILDHVRGDIPDYQVNPHPLAVMQGHPEFRLRLHPRPSAHFRGQIFEEGESRLGEEHSFGLFHQAEVIAEVKEPGAIGFRKFHPVIDPAFTCCHFLREPFFPLLTSPQQTRIAFLAVVAIFGRWMKAYYNIIVACSDNRVIGRNGRLPWHLPLDWRYFIDRTRGGTLLLGRRCHEEMLVLAADETDRHYVVVSRNRDLAGPHTTVASDFPTALQLATERDRPIWICGGQRIYEEALPLAHRLYLTRVHATVEGDAFFPDWQSRFRRTIWEQATEDSGYRLTFTILEPEPATNT